LRLQGSLREDLPPASAVSKEPPLTFVYLADGRSAEGSGCELVVLPDPEVPSIELDKWAPLAKRG
jgi:hypothetical protein